MTNNIYPISLSLFKYMMVPEHLLTLPPLSYSKTEDSVLTSFFLGSANKGKVAKRAIEDKKLVSMMT